MLVSDWVGFAHATQLPTSLKLKLATMEGQTLMSSANLSTVFLLWYANIFIIILPV